MHKQALRLRGERSQILGASLGRVVIGVLFGGPADLPPCGRRRARVNSGASVQERAAIATVAVSSIAPVPISGASSAT